MKRLVLLLSLIFSASAIGAVETPVRVSPSFGSWQMVATVTNDTETQQTAEMWQSIFQLGPDGQRVRSSVVLQPGNSVTFRVSCYSTRATYQWWTKLGNEVSLRSSVKCR